MRLTRNLLDELAAIAGVRVLGPLDTHARQGVVSFSIKGISPEDVCRHLDGKGVALRGDYHCAQPLVHAFGSKDVARELPVTILKSDVRALLTRGCYVI